MAGSNLVYLFAACIVVWIILFGFTLFLSRQIGDLHVQIETLRRLSQTPEPGEEAKDPATDGREGRPAGRAEVSASQAGDGLPGA